MNGTDITLDILTPTYNHEKFIAQCIEGVLSQKTNFKIRQLIGEDASTDKTRSIIQTYADKYPDIIIPHFREQNVGGYENSRLLFNAREAKYITILEGDDYWTDPYKLQKQVDLLEKNNEIVIAAHTVGVLNDKLDVIEKGQHFHKPVYTIKEYISKNFIPTCSAVFRNIDVLDDLPPWFFKVPYRDYALFLILAEHGNIYMFNDVMGVYRIHDQGMYSGNSYLQNMSGSYEFLVTYEQFAPGYIFKELNGSKAKYALTISKIYNDKGNQEEFLKYYKIYLRSLIKSMPLGFKFPNLKLLSKFLIKSFAKS